MAYDPTYFKLKNFACPCCGKNEMEESFLRRLDAARETAGVPFKVNSGYRCAKHNKLVGGKSNSPHLRGLAADIRVIASRKRFKVLDSFIVVGFERIGIAKTFLHADSDTSLPREVSWLY